MVLDRSRISADGRQTQYVNTDTKTRLQRLTSAQYSQRYPAGTGTGKCAIIVFTSDKHNFTIDQ